MYWYIVDILMVIIVIITVIVSASRGFVSSLVRMIGVFIAIFAAVVVAGALSETIFIAWFRKPMVEAVSEKIDMSSGIEMAIDKLSTGFIGFLLGIFGNKEKLSTFIESGLWQDKTIIAEKIVDGVIKNPLISLIKVALGLIIFLIVCLIIILIAKATGLLNKIPVVGGINRFFGAVLGLVYGIVICIAIVSGIMFALVLTSTTDSNIPLIRSSSYILTWLIEGKRYISF